MKLFPAVVNRGGMGYNCFPRKERREQATISNGRILMNKKRAITILALVLVLAVAVTVLAACDVYKQDSIGGGDGTANVVSNGGYVVKQGSYIYFINGYVGSVTSNEWGSAFKQSIMRAELNEDGSVKADSAKVLVPLSIYNQYAAGGIAVYGNWVYYATPNTDEDKTGTASTTYTDFMRTSTDGSVTQRIGTVASRSSEYLFTPTRILYTTDGTTVNYFDFSGMGSESTDDGKGAKAGTLIQNAGSILWGYDADRAANAGAQVSDYVFYTRTLTGDDSYRHYNELCAIRYDGTDNRVLATYDSWFNEGDTIENNYDKVFTFALKDLYYESDDEVVLYYTKSIYEDGSSAEVGFYSNTFSLKNGFSVKNEKKLTETAPTAFFPLGSGGILATKSSNVYLISAEGAENGDPYSDSALVIGAGRGAEICAVENGYVYYIDGDGDSLYRINLVKGQGEAHNEQAVVSGGVKSDWLDLEFMEGRFYYFDTEDYNYLHGVSLSGADGKFESAMIGVMTQEDLDAKAEAEKEEETAE